MTEELRVFVKWYDLLKWLLVTTEGFPKKARFTLTSRINSLSLDILEDIIECRYDRTARLLHFKRINIGLEKLRILLRMSHDLMYLSTKQFEHAMITVNEVGGMLYSWLKGTGREEIDIG